ncbi:hypothetical protein KUT41_17775 [Pseudomonas aeruginosa]|uniref:Uncharacterized protein n=1 Tax=Pseudomonas phage DMS3 TaxID=2913973 RepID=A0SMP5_9CAUD|nr:MULTISPECIES: hypothetical protein [Pseudomonas]YP_950459.1 hypothetical protein DMS3-35 [Pseudomonas phage DMS3]ABG66689.1 hypothetical protein DMS3-35 [Pseudomonas phage DMS3]EIU2890532.1 hypothetical protein [Pseudomonas aeruginosa]EIU3160137.1 hypothetical protein [Pseudomonas aeruginosa]EIU3547102.1 hypothetical protein [Pseudomonas aeruginosa]EIU3732242.1 hypothetical protein [Pseudomonas aeruginosa]
MNHAIAQLDIAAQIAEHNAPISEAQGDAAQAELQNQVAADCREALDVLEQLESPL